MGSATVAVRRSNMFYMQEFELVRDEGWVLAMPFDLEGGTQGKNVSEAMEMACDWLREEVLAHMASGKELPKTSFGNAPVQDGHIALIGVSVDLADVPSVSAAEAADMLGVSRPRVSSMIKSGMLTGWKEGRNTRVSVESIEARLAEAPRAGRPKKAVAVAV